MILWSNSAPAPYPWALGGSTIAKTFLLSWNPTSFPHAFDGPQPLEAAFWQVGGGQYFSILFVCLLALYSRNAEILNRRSLQLDLFWNRPSQYPVLRQPWPHFLQRSDTYCILFCPWISHLIFCAFVYQPDFHGGNHEFDLCMTMRPSVSTQGWRAYWCQRNTDDSLFFFKKKSIVCWNSLSQGTVIASTSFCKGISMMRVQWTLEDKRQAEKEKQPDREIKPKPFFFLGCCWRASQLRWGSSLVSQTIYAFLCLGSSVTIQECSKF